MRRGFLLPAILIIITMSGFSDQTGLLSIQINKKGFFVNKTPLSETWQVSYFETHFGKADRDVAGTLIYDDDGIKLFRKYKDGTYLNEVSELQIYYGSVSSEKNLPSNFFSGSFTIDKLKVTSGLNPQAVRSALKKWQNKEAYLPHSYRYNNDKVYIYFRFNDEENQLLQISIGPNPTY